MNFRNASIWTMGVLAAVVCVAFAPTVFATGPDNGPTYHDTDGDGMTDDNDPCPNNPDPTCSRQMCGTTTITGDGGRWTGSDCVYEYNGGVPCPDGTYPLTHTGCSTRGTDSDSDTGSGRGGGGSGGGGGGRDATPEPAAPALGTAQTTVEGCAAAKPGYSNIMDEAKAAAAALNPPLQIAVVSGQVAGGLGLMSCLGKDNGRGRIRPTSITITVDEATISSTVAGRRGTKEQTEYMHVFAEVLLHEYRHAYDCAKEQYSVKPTDVEREILENNADSFASENYRALFGTTRPLHLGYNHDDHGNPDCI